MRKIRLIIAALLVISPFAAIADPILDVQGGQMIGAMGVDVGGTLYDVLFVDGTCAEVFDGCDADSDFAFQTLELAILASEALLADVFLDQASGLFDSVPSLTTGCPGISLCVLDTPYHVAGTSLSHVFAWNEAVEELDRILPSLINKDNWDLSTQLNFTWAVWSPAVASVPEPGTLALVSLGLVGMGLARRRKKV